MEGRGNCQAPSSVWGMGRLISTSRQLSPPPQGPQVTEPHLVRKLRMGGCYRHILPRDLWEPVPGLLGAPQVPTCLLSSAQLQLSCAVGAPPRAHLLQSEAPN